jgi:transposase
MLKTFQYRLYPTKRQDRLLTEHLEELRWLWNTLLAERKTAWEDAKKHSRTMTNKMPCPRSRTRCGLGSSRFTP